MADYGAIFKGTLPPSGVLITAYSSTMAGVAIGPISKGTLFGPASAFITAYGIAGTQGCPECPDCPPPARFSLALGATPLGLALGSADT